MSAEISNKHVTYHHPMNFFLSIFIFFAGVLIFSNPLAQTTHQVSSTTLTESTLHGEFFGGQIIMFGIKTIQGITRIIFKATIR